METIKIIKWETVHGYPEDLCIHFSNGAELDYTLSDYDTTKDTPHRIASYIDASETTYDTETTEQRPITAEDILRDAETLRALAYVLSLVPDAIIEAYIEDHSSVEHVLWLTDEQFKILKP